MTCTYTGAYVQFDDYGAYTPADLFVVGDCVIIQWMPEGWTHDQSRVPTHRVTIGDGYHHHHRGVTVVKLAQIIGSVVR